MTALIISFVVLMILNMPISFVIGVSGFAYFLCTPSIPLAIAAQRVITQTQSFAFLAVPFFVFAGNLMNETGITGRLLKLASVLTRTMTGGLAQVSVVLSTLMGGISGSATADAAMEARILGPDMVKAGYSKGYTAAVICLTSLITATIPPSLGLIVYGFVGEVSIGRLFTAGIVPGILMMAVLMVTVSITAKRRQYDLPAPNIKRATVKEVLVESKKAAWALMFPVLLIVGIRMGLMTPSEAGAFAVVYSLFVGSFVYKELSWVKFKEALRNTFIDNGAIIFIVCMSGIFGYAFTYAKLPVMLSEFLFGITTNPVLLLFLILGFLVVSGMFVDTNINCLLLTPIFLPMVMELGVDPVHFGILMMTVVTMGIMTPPVGTAFYTVCGILKCPPEEFTKEALPFFFAILLEVAFLVIFPDVVLFLPNMIFGA